MTPQKFKTKEECMENTIGKEKESSTRAMYLVKSEIFNAGFNCAKSLDNQKLSRVTERIEKKIEFNNKMCWIWII